MTIRSHLQQDHPQDGFTGRVVGSPSRGNVPFVVHEAAIVEFYAR